MSHMNIFFILTIFSISRVCRTFTTNINEMHYNSVSIQMSVTRFQSTLSIENSTEFHFTNDVLIKNLIKYFRTLIRVTLSFT
jgi:hypothetical protein